MQTHAPAKAAKADAPQRASLSQRAAVRQALRGVQAKQAVSEPGDACEREADRVADTVMQGAEVAVPSAAVPPSVQRQCAGCGEEERAGGAGQAGASAEALRSTGGGQPLPNDARGFFEPRFGSDFSGIRVHDDHRAHELAGSLGARAFTYRNDIYFGRGEYQPESGAGKRLLAHELTHVVQQGASVRRAVRASGAAVAEREEEEGRARLGGVAVSERSGPAVMRDLAIEPPNPAAAAPVLTEDQINEAIRYNERRFQDPYTVMIIRDVVGIPKYPAVSDRDLALAIAQWQAEFNLTPDGKIGPATTRTFVRELRAEDQRRFADLVREDNMVWWTDVNARAYRACGEFQWDANFGTTLREGWLIQRIDNTWNARDCAGNDVTPAFTRRYWEAWWVDNNGRVWIPTNTANPPGTAAPATADDLWRNPPVAGSTGDWSQAGTMYTTLALPAGFAVRGVPEAMDLPATVGPVAGDDLGLPEASRRVAGRWDCCDADPARRFHRPA